MLTATSRFLLNRAVPSICMLGSAWCIVIGVNNAQQYCTVVFCANLLNYVRPSGHVLMVWFSRKNFYSTAFVWQVIRLTLGILSMFFLAAKMIL